MLPEQLVYHQLEGCWGIGQFEVDAGKVLIQDDVAMHPKPPNESHLCVLRLRRDQFRLKTRQRPQQRCFHSQGQNLAACWIWIEVSKICRQILIDLWCKCTRIYQIWRHNIQITGHSFELLDIGTLGPTRPLVRNGCDPPDIEAFSLQS